VINFVTGGSGFIGQRLVAALKQSSGEIRVLSRAKHSDYDAIICDLQSEVIPDQALNNINTVFHLAGFAHNMRDASKIADLYYKVNVSATVQLANLAVKFGVKGLCLLVVSRQVGIHLLEHARMRRIRKIQKMFTEKLNEKRSWRY
jgi:UDP-glucose 4-epimerase